MSGTGDGPGKWDGVLHTIKTCLIFDRGTGVIVEGDPPTMCSTIALAPDSLARGIDLERCIVTKVTIEQCEAQYDSTAEMKPHLFSIKLKDNAGKAIDCVMQSCDFPLTPGGPPSQYSEKNLCDRQKIQLTNFGHYTTKAVLTNLMDVERGPDLHLVSIWRDCQIPLDSCERGSHNDMGWLANKKNYSDFEKIKDELKEMFSDMRFISAEITVKDQQEDSASYAALIRVVLSIDILATKPLGDRS